MSNETNDGGPAFPVHKYVNADGETFTSEPTGMTIRDYFAAKAMTAIIFKYDDSNDDRAGPVVSDMAYAIADAMLAAREKTK